MKRYLWATIIAIVALYSTRAAFAQDANDANAEAKIKILEEKLNNLEQKQKVLELQLEIKKQAAAAEANSAQAEKLNELEQRQKVVERQLEIEREAAAEKAKTAPVVTANAKDGFSIKSPDNDFQLKLHGYIQADSRSVSGKEGATSDDTFLMRRVRPIFEGTVFKDTDFRIMPDFGDGKTVLQDAYFDFKQFPEAKLQVGKFKEPFGLERLQSATDLLFVERGLPTNLVPNRDIGAAFHGDLLDGKFSYAAGIFNGVPDGGSLDSDIDGNKEFAGRVFVNPWKGGEIALLDGLGVGFAVTAGNEDGTSSATYLGSYKTTGQQTFFSYRSDVVANGEHNRYSPQLYYSYGSFGLLSEYVISSQEVENADTEKINNTAWQIAASYVLTGEAASYKGVVPGTAFNPAANTWGAFEVVGRYSQLDVDDNAFPTFANPDTSARSAKDWGVGLNWYWNKNVKWMLDYDHTTFDGGAAGSQDREAENAVIARVQLKF